VTLAELGVIQAELGDARERVGDQRIYLKSAEQAEEKASRLFQWARRRAALAILAEGYSSKTASFMLGVSGAEFEAIAVEAVARKDERDPREKRHK
jgi:hypothetical protein